MFHTRFFRSSRPEPHLARRRYLLARHPEVRELSGQAPVSLLFVVGIVALQFALAGLLAHSPWWLVLIAAYGIGAVAHHGLLVLIHECTHNLVLKGSTANRIVGLVANLPLLFPVAMPFRKYHLLHHKHQGDPQLDADLPGETEARLVGNSTARKALWLLFFLLIEGVVRPLRLRKVQLVDGWALANLGFMVVAVGATVIGLGWGAVVYLFLSSFFSVGLHPVGARWIQEHFVMRSGQETYSYYGPLNHVAFNVGYHNEHHDLMTVPWLRLPRLRRMAPELYDSLYYHTSWSRLLVRFVFDRSLGLHSRVIRAGEVATASTSETRAGAASVTTADALSEPSVGPNGTEVWAEDIAEPALVTGSRANA